MTRDDEKIVDGLLDCQKEVIARMALAGWTFEQHSQRVQRRVFVDGEYQRSWQVETYVVAMRNGKVLPNAVRTEDVYAAACEAEKFMFMSGEIDSMSPKVISDAEALFELKAGNEQ